MAGCTPAHRQKPRQPPSRGVVWVVKVREPRTVVCGAPG